MIIIFGIIRVIATVVFLYLVWRRLREDYDEDSLLAYSWLFLLSFLVSGRAVFGLINWGVWNDEWMDWLAVWSKPGFDYVGGYVGALMFSFIYIRNKGWKLWNFAEDMTLIILLYLIILMLGETIFARFVLEAALPLVSLVVAAMLTLTVKDKYRSMVWYKSGKKGFVFLFANIVFSILASALSWWKGSELWISLLFGVWSLISMVGLVMLGEMNLNLQIKRK